MSNLKPQIMTGFGKLGKEYLSFQRFLSNGWKFEAFMRQVAG